jgi:hypothetical protein
MPLDDAVVAHVSSWHLQRVLRAAIWSWHDLTSWKIEARSIVLGAHIGRQSSMQAGAFAVWARAVRPLF